MLSPSIASASGSPLSMPPTLMPALMRLRALLVPETAGLGWMPFYHLGYLSFLFLPLLLSLFGQDGPWLGPTDRILWPTLLSVPTFLMLYFAAHRQEGVARVACMLLIALLACALLPFNSFANTYTIYACGFAAERGRALWRGVAWMVLSLALLLACVLWLRYPLFVFFITLIVAVAVFSANRHYMEITRKRAELQLSHEEVRRLAQSAERERIGRDLHDLLGHTLSLVALKSDLAAKLLARDPEAARREIDEVRRVARDALAQVRSAVAGMRAAAVAAELASARLLLECDGIAFDYALDENGLQAPGLPREVETALALALREAVTNVQRHAHATRVQVRIRVSAGEALLEAHDDGRGGALVPGNGLRGMRERIEAVGGRLRIDSVPGQGTRVEVRVPWRASAGAA